MGEADQRGVALGDQLDLDHAGAKGQRARSISQPQVNTIRRGGRPAGTARWPSRRHGRSCGTRRPGVGRVRLQPLPLQPAPWVGEEPEDGLWGGLDAALDHEWAAGRRHRGRSGSAASASSASRSSWLVHICSSSTENGCRAWRLAPVEPPGPVGAHQDQAGAAQHPRCWETAPKLMANCEAISEAERSLIRPVAGSPGGGAR